MSLQEQLDQAVAKIRTATAGVSATGGEFRLAQQEQQDIQLRKSFLSTIQEQTLIKLDLERQIQEALPEGSNLKNIAIIGLIVVGAIVVLR